LATQIINGKLIGLQVKLTYLTRTRHLLGCVAYLDNLFKPYSKMEWAFISTCNTVLARSMGAKRSIVLDKHGG